MAIEQKPDDGDIIYHRGFAIWRNNRWEVAQPDDIWHIRNKIEDYFGRTGDPDPEQDS